MWKVHTLVVVLAGALLLFGLYGSELVAGSFIDRWLATADIALQGALAYPSVGMLGCGVLLAYGIYGVWLLSRYYALSKWLVRLTDLWSEGVAIRADGLVLATDSQVTAWVERRYTGWHNRVVDTLDPLAPVDARIFATTPETPGQESGVTYRSPFHRIHLTAMSQELDKLKQIIDRHQGHISPVMMAMVTRLQGLQGGTFGHIPRAREIEREDVKAA